MSKRILAAILLSVLIVSLFFAIIAASGLTVSAHDVADVKKIRCTCYCHSGITASGQQTREGIAAGRKDWLGCVAGIYSIAENGELGEFLGYYEFLDTGAGMDTDGDGKGDSIIRGQSIDLFKNSLDDAKAWIREHGDYVYLQIIEAEG